MGFGCSECLCIAIECHRPALLKSLLRRTDIVYRDIFWAPTPREWTENNSTYTRMEIPVLHYFGAESDLSFVGREDCGHARVDADLETPFDVLWNRRNAYILVSLPMMARWHSNKSFNAERILWQCGKFEYSAPQFFHVHNKYTFYYQYEVGDWFKEYGPLYSARKLVLRCEFEGNYVEKLLLPHSSLPHGMLIMQGEFQKPNMYFSTSYGMLSRLLYENWNLIDGLLIEKFSSSRRSYFSELTRFSIHFQRLLRTGADINHPPYGYETLFESKRFRELHHYDLLGGWCRQPLYYTSDDSRNILCYTKLILRNGLSFFYGDVVWDHLDFGYCYSIDKEFGLIEMLIFTQTKCCIRIAYQLLALGYGRRELHRGDLTVRDEHLELTRNILDYSDIYGDECESEFRDMQQLVDHFDAGPLTLQQLARIAIRRAVGGIDFARRIRKIAYLMPPPLLQYVADADELLTLEP